MVSFAKREFVLLVFTILLVVLSIFHFHEIAEYPSFVDWRVIKALLGLLVITTGLKESGYFSVLSRRLLARFRTERGISLFMIVLSAMFSTFLTNDVALLVVVPLTLSMQRMIKGDISKLVVFEALAVNVGSTLTPFGNPQNLFLWHRWEVSMSVFVIEMLPLVALMLGLLLMFAWLAFSKREIEISDVEKVDEKPLLFILSMILLVVFVVSLETGHVDLTLILTFSVFFLFYRRIFLSVDWLLILLFIVIFIDFHMISTLSVTSKVMRSMDLSSERGVFLSSVLISQVLSNVPASVLLSKFTHNWPAVIYGVNVGGNGLVMASLANLIALRMVREKRVWLEFHRYSISYLVVSTVLVYASLKFLL